MQLTCQITGLDETLRRLSDMERAAVAGSAETTEAMRTIGLLELEAQRTEFLARSRGGEAGGFAWRKVSPLTVLLRRSGATKKLPDWGAVVALADVAPIMMDTGRLAASLASGAPGNVLDPRGLAVTVGTSVEYAQLVSEGGQGEPPIQSAEEADRVASRLLKVLHGHKPAQTPGGRKSWAKKFWNPAYFLIRGWLRKLVGRTFAVPPRPVLSTPPEDRLQGYGQRLKDAFVKIAGGK
jgi:hypothetical protein